MLTSCFRSLSFGWSPLPSFLTSLRAAPPSPRRSALSSVLRVSPFPLPLAMLETKDWSLSNLLLIAVMSPFGVGPEAGGSSRRSS